MKVKKISSLCILATLNCLFTDGVGISNMTGKMEDHEMGFENLRKYKDENFGKTCLQNW